MTFAQQLSKLMDSRSLTNYQLAKDLDIHPTTVANWLSGKIPMKKTLAILADYFGVSVDELIGNAENEKKPPTVRQFRTVGGLLYNYCVLLFTCFAIWSAPVAARPDTTPTAAAVIGSFAGNSGTPMYNATMPSIRPATPQAIGIYLLLLNGVAFTTTPTK